MLLLAAAAMLPTACGSAGDNGQPGDPAAPQADAPAQAEPAETAPETIPSGLPDMDLGGFTLTLFRSGVYFPEYGVWRSELTGDAVNDAIFNRNKYLEETYGCVIELLETDEEHASKAVSKYVASGDDTVDVVFDGGEYIGLSAASFLDLNGLEHFHFDQPWWNRDFNKGVTIGGKLYFTIGCYQTTALEGIRHVVFNKNVAGDYGIEPDGYYDLVRRGGWVIDRMAEDALKVKADLNGDGAYDRNDLWGLVGENYVTWSLALGCGFKCAEKDADDMPVITFASEDNIAVMDKVLRITGNQEVSIIAQRLGTEDKWTIYGELLSSSGQWLFTAAGLMSTMRAMADDYGVLPSPKFDESQDRYYHDASLGLNPTTAVPVSASDPDTVSYLMEAMCWASYNQVLPEFYENYLNTKMVRDEESVEMLRIVHNSLYYDIGALYNWGDMRMNIEGMTENNLATKYAKTEKSINKALDKTLAAFGF